MEEMTRKQPDVDRVTKTYKRKTVEPTHTPFVEKSHRGSSMFQAAVFCSVVREQQFPSACEDSFHLQKLIGLEPKFFLIFLLTHLFFLILIYFSFILKAEWQIFHLLMRCPNAHKSQGRTKQKLETWNYTHVPHGGGRNPVSGPWFSASQDTLVGNWVSNQST